MLMSLENKVGNTRNIFVYHEHFSCTIEIKYIYAHTQPLVTLNLHLIFPCIELLYIPIRLWRLPTISILSLSMPARGKYLVRIGLCKQLLDIHFVGKIVQSAM